MATLGPDKLVMKVDDVKTTTRLPVKTMEGNSRSLLLYPVKGSLHAERFERADQLNVEVPLSYQ